MGGSTETLALCPVPSPAPNPCHSASFQRHPPETTPTSVVSTELIHHIHPVNFPFSRDLSNSWSSDSPPPTPVSAPEHCSLLFFLPVIPQDFEEGGAAWCSHHHPEPKVLPWFLVFPFMLQCLRIFLLILAALQLPHHPSTAFHLPSS